jgi:hypothetical protein
VPRRAEGQGSSSDEAHHEALGRSLRQNLLSSQLPSCLPTLAAATTTGNWIVGGIAVVVGLGIFVGIVWLLYRLVTWPARARRATLR